MLRILAVAINTFREAVRDRVLYGLLGVGIAVVTMSFFMAELSLDQQERVMLDVGLASISLFSVVTAIFLGSSLLYKEIERKTLYVILPKAVARHEFLLGKFFGIVLTAFVFINIIGAIQLCVAAVQAELSLVLVGSTVLAVIGVLLVAVWRARDRTSVVVPWSALALAACAGLAAQTSAPLVPALASMLLTLCEVLLLTSVALLFSSFSTPFLTALFSFAVWLVGRSADAMVDIPGKALPQFIKDVLEKLVLVWPNFHLFVPGRNTLIHEIDNHAGPMSYVASSAIYAVCYSAILLLLASLIFRRRDFI